MSSLSIDNLNLSNEQNNAGKFFAWLLKKLSNNRWIFNLGILLTGGFLYTVLTRRKVKRLKEKSRNRLRVLVEKIDDLEDRQAMNIHEELEDIIARIEEIIKVSKKFYVFLPVRVQYGLMLKDFKDAERIFFNHLYPDYHRTLTAEEKKELEEAFRPWREDSQKILTHG